MLSLDRCRAILQADPATLPYSDDEVRELRAFLYDLAGINRACRSNGMADLVNAADARYTQPSTGLARPDAPSPP